MADANGLNKKLIIAIAILSAVGFALAEDHGTYGTANPEAEEGYSYTLFIKNKELTPERIDLRVNVDGHIAVFDQLRPGDVEDVYTIKLRLEPGKHRLLVEAIKGSVATQQEVVIDGAGSAEVDLWFFPQPETWPYFEEGVPPEGDPPVLNWGHPIRQVD